MDRSAKKDEICVLLKRGLSYEAIAQKVSCAKSTVSYHAHRLAIRNATRPKYDWLKIQKYHDAGRSRTACMEEFGFARRTWDLAVRGGRLKPRDWKIPLAELLVFDRKTNRTHLKQRLLKAALLEFRCYQCGISDWQGWPLSLELEHKNGDRRDNRLKNLCLLCPNCHSQTPTHGSKNKGRYLPGGVTVTRVALNHDTLGSNPSRAAN